MDTVTFQKKDAHRMRTCLSTYSILVLQLLFQVCYRQCALIWLIIVLTMFSGTHVSDYHNLLARAIVFGIPHI